MKSAVGLHHVKDEDGLRTPILGLAPVLGLTEVVLYLEMINTA